MTKYGVIYDAHTRREFGSVEIMRCLWILLLLKNISVVGICGWREWGGGAQNWPFFVDVINVWPIRVWQLKIKTMCHLRNVEVTTRRVLEM